MWLVFSAIWVVFFSTISGLICWKYGWKNGFKKGWDQGKTYGFSSATQLHERQNALNHSKRIRKGLVKSF